MSKNAREAGSGLCNTTTAIGSAEWLSFHTWNLSQSPRGQREERGRGYPTTLSPHASLIHTRRTRMRLPSNMLARGGEARSVDTELSRALERSEVIGASDDREGKLDVSPPSGKSRLPRFFYPFRRLSCLRNGRPEMAAGPIAATDDWASDGRTEREWKRIRSERTQARARRGR